MYNLIDFENDEYSGIISEDEILEWILKILKELEKDDCYLSVSFTDNRGIRDLNREYRGKDKETDVLSFSQIEGDEFDFDNKFLGDIIISVPYASEQAVSLGHSLMSEVKYLILHGFLHLLGYDHDEDEKGDMSRIEKEVYEKLTGETIE